MKFSAAKDMNYDFREKTTTRLNVKVSSHPTQTLSGDTCENYSFPIPGFTIKLRIKEKLVEFLSMKT